MSKQIPHEIIDRASEWLIEMRETNVSDTKREAFAEWLRSSPAHVQAYLEVAGIWGDASQVSKEFILELAHAASTNVVAISEGRVMVEASLSLRASAGEEEGLRIRESLQERDSPHIPETPEPGTTLRPRAPNRTHLAIAATVLLAIAAGSATWWQATRAPTYSADVGEQRVITLDDGSIVRLNSRSKMRVRLTPQERHIELLEGQAHFQVAKDAARPFTVHTHDITARAVGTQFDVYRRKHGTTVTVLEGRVAVEASPHNPLSAHVERGNVSADSATGAGQASSRSEQQRGSAQSLPLSISEERGGVRTRTRDEGTRELLLAAGQQATVTPTGSVQLQPEANIAAATGWLQQELIFTGEALSTVIDEFNRYTRRTIVLDDPTLADFKINAAFNTTNPQGLLLFLSRMDGVTISETEDEIHVTRREPQK